MNAQQAAATIWAWVGSPECEELVCSDLAECQHEKALRTSEEIEAIAVARIRRIIEMVHS